MSRSFLIIFTNTVWAALQADERGVASHTRTHVRTTTARAITRTRTHEADCPDWTSLTRARMHTHGVPITRTGAYTHARVNATIMPTFSVKGILLAFLSHITRLRRRGKPRQNRKIGSVALTE